MFKKKKIRENFDEVFKTGDEHKIKEMLEEHPWLLEEMSQEMDELMSEEHQVIAALGVMEDELGGPVPVDEIVFSLRVDFNTKKSEEEVYEILTNAKTLDLVKKETSGWVLTNDGGRLCDDYLNQNFEEIEL